MDNAAVWQKLQLSQGSQALAILVKAGIPCMLLKGAAGLAAGWLKANDRPLTDVDVLLPPSRLAEAVALLCEYDWEPNFRPPSAPDALRHSREVWSPWGFVVDLHWFALRHARWAGVDDVLWRRARQARLGDLEILIPSAEDFLVHTIAHGARRAGSGARWREDVKAVITHPAVNLNWAHVIESAANYKVPPLIADALESMAGDLGSKIVEPACQELRRVPMRWSDRLFLQLSTNWPEEPGLVQALIVVLDYRRTRPARIREMPSGLLSFLRDRWELSSRCAALTELWPMTMLGLRTDAWRAGQAFRNWRGKDARQTRVEL